MYKEKQESNEIRQARKRFSDRLASMLSLTGPIPLAIALARVEWTAKVSKYIPCNHCPYVSKSFHESSLHGRLH